MNQTPVKKPILNPLLATRVLCRRSLFHFVKTFWHVVIAEEPVYNWHIIFICEELQKVAIRVIHRLPKEYDLAINVPPGTTKSTLVTQMLPAWIWTLDATIRTMSGSYSGGLAVDHSTKSRDIIKSELYQKLFPEVKIRHDVDGKTHYKTTAGGERYAAGIHGTITGFHAHLILIDDPVTPRGSGSEAERESANLFMDHTISTRKVEKSLTPTILVMQRLHENDPTGNWLNKNKAIRHICLPAELSSKVNPPELAAKYENGLLDPVRLSRDVLTEMHKDLGSYGYAGQMQQDPSPQGGGIWKKWIIPIADRELDQMIKEKKLQQTGSDWDTAYTKEESNSASAFITSGIFDKKMYITALGFDWLEFPELITYMKIQQEPHYIEAKATGKSAKQTLTKSGIPAIEVKVKGGTDKIARANLATPYAEAGMVYCRQSILERLYSDSKQGILAFPNTGTDLQDALVQAINRLLANASNRVRSSTVSGQGSRR